VHRWDCVDLVRSVGGRTSADGIDRRWQNLRGQPLTSSRLDRATTTILRTADEAVLKGNIRRLAAALRCLH
jgi:hypothetical protein